jgi:uncharacterized membrane protein YqjE
MTDAHEQPAVEVGEAARNRYLEDDLRRLVDLGLTFAKAEAELQKARGRYAAGRLKWIALLGVLAGLLVVLSLVALTVGMVMALTPLLGAVGATLVVFGALVVAALLCAVIVGRQWRDMMAALTNSEPR